MNAIISNQQCIEHYLARLGIAVMSISMLTSAEWGPQVWDNDGNQGEMTEVEDLYMVENEYHERVYLPRKQLVSYPISAFDNKPLPKDKLRKELNDEEQCWMDCHEAYLPQLDEAAISTWECNTYDDETVSNEATSLSNNEYSKDATEQDSVQYRFWLRVKSLACISPNKGRDFVTGHPSTEWLDAPFGNNQDDFVYNKGRGHHMTAREYALSLMTNDTPKRKYSKYLSINARKVINRDWGKPVNVITLPYGITVAPMAQDFDTSPELGVISRWYNKQPLSITYQEDIKLLHIDVYPSIPTAKEGFLQVWTTINGVFASFRRVSFISNEKGRISTRELIAKADKAGYKLDGVRNMYNECIAKTGKSPRYTTVRKLQGIAYTTANIKELVC